MANLKNIRKRILSVKSTQQITNAMKMVAAARLRKAQDRIEILRPYADKMEEILASIALRTNPETHPLLIQRPPEKAMLILLTSDRGLCGAFNQNIIKAAELFIRNNRQKYSNIHLTIIGKKGHDFYKKRDTQIYKDFTGVSGKLDFALARKISIDLNDRFLTEKADEIYLIYNRFHSAINQELTFNRLLPIAPLEISEDDFASEYLFEPTETEILDGLLLKHIETQIFRSLLESEASELGARMTAMESATSNADDMIERLTLEYNRARQESITNELMEIIGGAEALKS